MTQRLTILVIGLLSLSLSSLSSAAIVRVAVASNFSNTLKSVVESYEQSTGHRVRISSASSGKLYAQIKQGAPFDVFLSADQTRPKMLLKEGFSVFGSSKTYAVGQLVLWTNQELGKEMSMEILRSSKIRRIAIANPVFAPYGQAALQAIDNSGLTEDVRKKVVRGENIGQAMQFVSSHNAQVGFLALSQSKLVESGKVWLIPKHLYTPIRQDVLALNNKQVTQDFLNYLLSNEAQQIIRESGYESP